MNLSHRFVPCFHFKKIATLSQLTEKVCYRMLVSELERHQYVESTVSKMSSLRRNGDGKRKIDYILYKECDNVTVVSNSYLHIVVYFLCIIVELNIAGLMC